MCKSRATHWALITCNISCVTWYERTAQLLSLAEFRSHLFFSFILLAETINRRRKGTLRKPLRTSFSSSRDALQLSDSAEIVAYFLIGRVRSFLQWKSSRLLDQHSRFHQALGLLFCRSTLQVGKAVPVFKFSDRSVDLPRTVW